MEEEEEMPTEEDFFTGFMPSDESMKKRIHVDSEKEATLGEDLLSESEISENLKSRDLIRDEGMILKLRTDSFPKKEIRKWINYKK